MTKTLGRFADHYFQTKMHRMKNTFTFFCLLAAPVLFGQNQIDSLKNVLAQTADPAQQLEINYQISQGLSNSNPQQSLVFAKKGIEISQKLGEKATLPKLLLVAGSGYVDASVYDSADIFFKKAVEAFAAVGNQKGQADTYLKMAHLANRTGDYVGAFDLYFKALRLGETLGEPKISATAHGALVELFAEKKQAAEARDHAQKAIEICEKNNLLAELPFAYHSLGLAYFAEPVDYQKAFEAWDKAYQIVQQPPFDEKDLAIALNDRANGLKRLNRHAEALENYGQALAIVEKMGWKMAVAATHANIGEVNLRMGKFREALPHQLKAIEIFEKQNDSDNLPESYEHASAIYEGLGDFKNALVFRKKMETLGDSLSGLEKDAAMSELQTQYETEKKETTIAAQTAQIGQQKTVQWAIGGVAALLAGFLFFLRRINISRKKANQELAVSNEKLGAKNAENELLLKEIHHRVKNNLQTISSLLNLQSASISDQNALEAVQESQSRVRSMALIHQKLYQGENLAAVEMKSYFETMGEAMLHSFGDAGKRVSLNVEMPELEMDVDTAIPLGLIANELITNSLKYAFPENRPGKLKISLTTENDQQFLLKIADDGVGFDKKDKPKGTGFGTRLVSLLAMQLNGKVETQTENGTATFVKFQPLAKAA